MIRAFSFHQIFFGLKAFATDTVQSHVLFFVNIVVCQAGLPKSLRAALMPLFGRADKIIVRDIPLIGQFLE
jgi:hypothetical protein